MDKEEIDELIEIRQRIREIKTELDVLATLRQSDKFVMETKLLMFENLLNTVN